MKLVAFVLSVHEHLARAEVPHAFGGALALAYYGQPRATIDVDLNVFVEAADEPSITEILRSADLEPEEADRAAPIGGRRYVRRGGPTLDVFLDIDPTYRAIRDRVVHQPFGPGATPLPFLSAEDLVAFKLSFGRARDWVDLEDVVRNDSPLDVDVIESTLLALRGPHMHPRLARLRAMVAERARS